jgi:4-amino-4-deoxy-L-arabinose transferase-like glycosyltransferase
VVPDEGVAAPPAAPGPLRRYPEVLAIVLGGLVLRLPYVVSRAPLVFDDSVYYASIGAMRAGGAPFRDVFSSQGPAYLPLVWLGDRLGGRTDWSPRLVPLLAGLVLIVLVHRLGLRVSDRTSAGIAAVLVAASGSVIYATSRLLSDGVAITFATAAVLAACDPRTRRVVAASLLLGLAFAVKSIFVIPAGLAVGWLVLRRRGLVAAAATGAGSLLVPVVLSIPWGVGRVWDQYVGLHLRVRTATSSRENLELVRDVVRQYDRWVLGAALVAVATVVWRRLQRSAPRPTVDPWTMDLALWAWLLGGVLGLRLQHPLFVQHVGILIPPAALLVARARPPLVAIAAVGLLLLPSHARGAEWRRTEVTPTVAERDAIERLEHLEPPGGRVISDEPMLAWLADRTSPGSMVDMSYVRLASGDLTVDEVAHAAEQPGVCAVVMWTGRLASVPGLEDRLPDYHEGAAIDGHRILVRSDCRD